ncbi:MAG: hypothetical protein IPP98_10205 [Gemmatimonadetes bacterium]|nr:hypothetical protein [Gemmatimonadota bacterium]
MKRPRTMMATLFRKIEALGKGSADCVAEHPGGGEQFLPGAQGPPLKSMRRP